MSNEPRKASDILLSLESKVDQLISLYRSQDLVLKVLSNKLNNLIDAVNSSPSDSEPKPSTQQILNVSSEFQLPVEIAPKGFRRTSRPETYDVPEKPAPKAQLKTEPPTPVAVSVEQPSVEFPIQFPDYEPKKEPPGLQNLKKPKSEIKVSEPSHPATPGNKVPVEQRVVDKNGKAIFLANVELLNSAGESEYKTRTNGVGKWQASLGVGTYQVKISKQESVSKEKIEVVQDITVDGLSVTQSLPVLICK